MEGGVFFHKGIKLFRMALVFAQAWLILNKVLKSPAVKKINRYSLGF